ncbi:hypothetical protein O2K51_02415 [Apibacter raozihei]|uniref:hypothetical protein n=1 Tax=Apibacter raozihei TaxID=2500547 RepID=UPI000FE2FD09|nr:hypothetical protein [Apibacter raozihei]
MKKLGILTGVLCILCSCSRPANQTLVGNDSDKHGCKGSAGYQWSQLKNDCIRTFEDGVQLSPVSVSTSAAYVLKVKDKVEVFEASVPGSVVLIKQNDKSWKNGVWEVDNVNGKYLLKKNGKVIYQN